MSFEFIARERTLIPGKGQELRAPFFAADSYVAPAEYHMHTCDMCINAQLRKALMSSDELTMVTLRKKFVFGLGPVWCPLGEA